MDFVKREDQNVIDEENYKIYMETLQKSHQMEIPEYQHTPISMEQIHQAMQSSLNAGTLMHNLQLPLSPRQMSTLMLKTNHLSRSLNFNEIPAHLQRNLELDLVHNLASELPQSFRHDEFILSRNLDLNLARNLTNELDVQNGLAQTLVQNLNDHIVMPDGNLQNVRNDLELNHEIDLSHHLNRNIEHDMMQERRTPMQCVQESQILDQNLAQRLDGNLQQRFVAPNLNLHDNQRLDGEQLLPMPFHIKSEQEDEGYFYDNMNTLQNVNGINGHISDHPQPQSTAQQEPLYVYSTHVNLPPVSNVDIYPRPQNYQQTYNIRENPQNLVVNRTFENSSPYDDKKDRQEPKNEKNEEPKENLKPTDQNKMFYQEYSAFDKDNAQKDEVIDIRGEYVCYKCNLVYPSKRLLKQHAKTCNDDGDSEKLGKFSCTQCSYRCQAPATLKIHERTHTGEKPFSCMYCDYKSGQKNNVAKHILVHMKEKPFRCQYCDYRCAQKNNLVVHERTHTGDKPFACSYCDYRTVQKPNLVKHMYLHTDQKPFSCDVCSYRCVQKTNLTKHKLRHLNEKDGDKLDAKNQIKPYRPRQKSVKCPHCSYRCVQKASLEKHMVYKHSEVTNGQGLNLMKVNEMPEDSIQNLSVKRDAQVYEACQEIKEMEIKS